MMEGKEYQCRQCYGRSDEEGACDRCGAKEKVDLGDEAARQAWLEELCERALKGRKKKVRWMRFGAFGLAAVFWATGLWLVMGVEASPVVLSWAVKMVSVAILAAGWWGAPRIYDRHLEGEAQRSLRELEGE